MLRFIKFFTSLELMEFYINQFKKCNSILKRSQCGSFFFWQEPRQKNKEIRGGTKRKGFESDDESPPRKVTNHAHRRMAVVYDSDED